MAKRPKKKVGITAKTARKSAGRTTKKAAPTMETVQLMQAPIESAAAGDFEDLLIGSLMTDKTGGIYKDISTLDMIFDLTHAGRELGYQSGFIVGNGLYQKSNSRIEVLFKALQLFGLGNVLYYPSAQNVLITANDQRRGHTVLNENIHVYESGVIAGFLSAATGLRISVHEDYCIYNRSLFCQFIADSEAQDEKVPRKLGQDAVVNSIAQLIKMQPSGVVEAHTEHEYYMLPMLPLMKKPLATETERILYLAGVQLAGMAKNENPEEVVHKIGYYMDLKGVSIEKGRENRRIIRLKYKHYNSLDQLVKLSTSLFVGFLTTALNTKPELEMSNDTDKSYVVKIKIKWAD